MVEKMLTRDPRYDAALKAVRRRGADLVEIGRMLTEAHSAGDARASYALATWYLHGQVYKKDVRRSVALLRAAARHDVPEALYDLAICYEQGEGVRKNPGKAVELYVRAALHGERQSLYEVGRCYYHGIGVTADRRIARVWFDRAKAVGVSS